MLRLEDDALVSDAPGHVLAIEIFEQRNGVFASNAE